MKAFILNSGTGNRMGMLTRQSPKCMTQVSSDETILSRQLRQLVKAGIHEVVITTGPFDDTLRQYVGSLVLPLSISFVRNPVYDRTNYIYSIFLARDQVQDTILLIHGDLVFSEDVLEQVLDSPHSCMTVSSTLRLPEKDFKAVIAKNRVSKIGVEFYDNAMAAQPLYKLLKKDWRIWLSQIICFCNNHRVNCYAENAFNEISAQCAIYGLDIKDSLCNEIDTPEDLAMVRRLLKEKK